MTDLKKIGFIGLGLMGQHMARNILNAGYPLTVWNRSQDKATALISEGATWADSPNEVAKRADIIITMVTNSAASEEVICGKNGILEGANKGMIMIDMGSIAPETSRSISERCEAVGVSMLDAPVTGAPHVAEAGKLGIMIGGDEAVFERCRPLLETMSAVTVYAGKSGQGSTLKLINNLILGVAIEAVAESLVLAEKAGIDPNRVVEITSVGGARTGAMETRGPKMIEGNFNPGFTISNMYKDLSNAMSLADQVDVTLPTTSATLEVLRAARANGLNEKDSCAVIKIIESLAGIGD